MLFAVEGVLPLLDLLSSAGVARDSFMATWNIFQCSKCCFRETLETLA